MEGSGGRITANNAYIFPGFGLGLIMSGTTRVHDDLLWAASEALAAQVSQENFDKGLIYPPFTNIRKISAHIAANVASKAYELGLATRALLSLTLLVASLESLSCATAETRRGTPSQCHPRCFN
ncbi:hypothetical protein JHK82_043655 [Glycine max]|uniref:Malic enzyme NAD-binding domain-containing protein n=2 Tax=Glycine max TaxID=3847 RepID=A0A0R0G5F6_SOYBN|nr:hypothetical protein JHK86_043541 [Glycine max]KAG4957822.1 hypothetical protein JHK85_044202 [Glycine max]KAG5106685.1 hypothetical protein JHK82_043655 [Glycine max]KAG5117610.1 hypothetical protein JHK84_043723 [Glycine max]